MPRLLCAEYFKSAVVAQAKLIGVRSVVPEDKGIAHVYMMELQAALRGRISNTFEVFEERDSARVSFEWKRGESYLLFLNLVPGEKVWQVIACGYSSPWSSAAKTLKVLESFKDKPSFGTIHGVIVELENGLDNSGETWIEIQGKNHVYKVRANSYGKFKIRVPIGDYRARAFHDGWKIEPDAITFEWAEKIHLERGGCAQIQFAARKDEREVRR